MTVAVVELDEVAHAVRESARLLPFGGGTKPALSTPPDDDVVRLDMRGLRGIVEYDPRELTITALAGTPVSELRDALATHGQQLPFDPPLGAAGATLGGVVAAGTSGPGAFRHGGVRDFVIGVRFVDGTGRLVGGGGRVVKNAAGFDLPKLLVGSLGRLGVIVQLSLKVFPLPRATATAVLDCAALPDAITLTAALARSSLAIQALELEPPGRVLARLVEGPEAVAARVARVADRQPDAVIDGDDDSALWDSAAELSWVPEGSTLVRVALTLRAVEALDAELAKAGALVRYGLGMNVAWIAWPRAASLTRLDAVLAELELGGTPLTGPPREVRLGHRDGGAFATRIRAALDPDNRFLEA